MGEIERRHLKKLMEGISKEQKGIMTARRMDATGESRSLIDYKIEGNKATLLGPAHIEFMERGRGPGKFPPEEPILNWVKAKGLSSDNIKSLVFLIRRKIAREGTVLHRTNQKTGILSKAITPERIRSILPEYVRDKRVEIRSNFVKAFK